MPFAGNWILGDHHVKQIESVSDRQRDVCAHLWVLRRIHTETQNYYFVLLCFLFFETEFICVALVVLELDL